MLSPASRLRRRTRWYPSEADRLALLASLLDDPQRARRSFEAWAGRSTGALEGSNRLYPLLFGAARKFGWDDPIVERIRSDARRTAAFSALVRHFAVEELRSFHRAGLDPVVLKGVALQATAYGSVFDRPVSDVDLLVDPPDAVRAIAMLRRDGWTTVTKEVFGPGRFASYASAGYFRGTYEQLDIHWRITYWSRDPTLTARVLSRSVRFDLDGLDARTLDPTDHLLHAIAHGIAWEEGVSVRWVPDAVHLVRGGRIEWDRFVDEVDRCGLVPCAREALQFLASTMECEIPGTVLRDLGARRSRFADELTHWIRVAPPSRARLAARLIAADYLRRTAGERTTDRLAGYVPFLWHTVRGSLAPSAAGLSLRRDAANPAAHLPRHRV